MAARAVIFGCLGTTLSDAERDFFRASEPWGFILFARNIVSPEQVRALTDTLRETVGRDAPVLIDQEGGRVARMRAPHWREWAPALVECDRQPDVTARRKVMHLRSRIIASELRRVGVDVNCAPVLDLAGATTHAVLKNRCYGSDPAEVAKIGRAVAEGLMQGGVLPILKHIPGQGRAPLDSHAALPKVEADAEELRADFAPFRALSDLPMAMTAHVIYPAHDPERPATLSPEVNHFIREVVGFDGLLMTDDLSMHALSGPFGARASAALDAGCDVVLHCNGSMDEMEVVATATPALTGRALARAKAALARRSEPETADLDTMIGEYEALTRSVADA
ncbi:MAG: beta-N-acetylhexosaminidase [Pseudomonadota bacterium]